MTIQRDTLQSDPHNPPVAPQEFESALPLLDPSRRPRILRPLAWRIWVTLLVFLILAIIGLLAGTSLVGALPRLRPAAFDAGAPLVMAFYYSWFDENTWTYDRLSDLPSESYISRDRGVMGRHIEQAQAAGIDAFLLAWYGPAGGHNQTEPNLGAMLDEAAARGFKIGILFETDGPFFGGVGDVTAALQHARATHFNHPAYLRVGGRPVVYFWRPTIYGVDTWRTIRDQSDPDYSSIWISEGVNTGYLNVFDGHHLYSNTWNPPADLHAVNRRYAGEVAASRDRLGAYKFWVATVMPGYDDVRIRAGAGGFAQDRQGGAYYTRAWDAAIDSNPNWIVINSFNEWPEGSYIEPSVAHGDHYMNLTREHSSRYKSGGGSTVALPPPGEPAPPPEPTPEPTPTPEPDVPTAFVEVAMLNLRAGPSVDFPVVTQLAQGAALPITGRHATVQEWWQVEIDSQTGWVHRDFVGSGGPLEQIALLDDSALPTFPAADTIAVAAGADLAPESAVEAGPGTQADPLPGSPDAATVALLSDPTESGDLPHDANHAPDAADPVEGVAPGASADTADAERPESTAGLVATSATQVQATAQNASPDTRLLDGANLENAMLALSQAILTLVHPVPEPNRESLHPVLSR